MQRRCWQVHASVRIDARRSSSIERLSLRASSLISSTADAASRIIFQTSHVRIVSTDCVLRLRAAPNYIAAKARCRVAAIK
jgi:hypothetical protein